MLFLCTLNIHFNYNQALNLVNINYHGQKQKKKLNELHVTTASQRAELDSGEKMWVETGSQPLKHIPSPHRLRHPGTNKVQYASTVLLYTPQMS